jgi:hypothetical protein
MKREREREMDKVEEKSRVEGKSREEKNIDEDFFND